MSTDQEFLATLTEQEKPVYLNELAAMQGQSSAKMHARHAVEIYRSTRKKPHQPAPPTPVPRSKTEGEGEGIAARHLSHESVPAGPDGQLADSDQDGFYGKTSLLLSRRSQQEDPHATGNGTAGLVAHSKRIDGRAWRSSKTHRAETLKPDRHSTDNYWSNADWIACSDGKSRPTQSGVHPLAHGTFNRVGRLRAYGNALCSPQAQAFITAVMQTIST